ncbi:DUF6404 family protein [Vibrio sinaloensis]|uniref:DUF6404 family protein n=1 Tax=Photobacterium sp. (strain ATCC 43367) TaxID=379097 RepID=UPI003AFB683E
MCKFKTKYRKSSLELEEKGLKIQPFIIILNSLGMRFRPLYYNEFYTNIIVVYVLWLFISVTLSLFSIEFDFVFIFVFPAFVSLMFSIYYRYQFRTLNLTPWRCL